MNIINRICAMHAKDYNLVPDPWMDSVHLEYGTGVTVEFRKQLERMMNKLGLPVFPYERELNLQLDVDEQGVCRLSRSGELLYRFAQRTPHLRVPYCNVTEAVAWTIYAIASQNEENWLRNESSQIVHGAYVACRSFSAMQQAVAYRLMRSANAQNVSDMPHDWVNSVLQDILVHAKQFAEAVPLFTRRPISESAYKAYRGKPVEKKLEKIATDLFGTSSFEEEVTAYCEYVKQSDTYAEQVNKAHKQLMRIIYSLPILAVDRFLGNFNQAIVLLNDVSLSLLDDMLDKQVRFSMTPEKLKNAFAETDSLCEKYAKNIICQAFLRDVLKITKQELGDEQSDAQNICNQMGLELSRFCSVQEDSFAEVENAPLIGWKQLMNLQERDLAMEADICWSAKSMIHLQRKIEGKEKPNCWISSQTLQEAVERQLTTDQFGTQGVPLVDQRCVIALWVREYVE